MAARADTTGLGGLPVLSAAAAVAAAADDTGELIRAGHLKGQAAAAAGNTGWGQMPDNHSELVRDGHRRGKAAGNVRAPETKQRAKRARPGQTGKNGKVARGGRMRGSVAATAAARNAGSVCNGITLHLYASLEWGQTGVLQYKGCIMPNCLVKKLLNSMSLAALITSTTHSTMSHR